MFVLQEAVEVVHLNDKGTVHAINPQDNHRYTYCGRMAPYIGSETMIAGRITCMSCQRAMLANHSLIEVTR